MKKVNKFLFSLQEMFYWEVSDVTKTIIDLLGEHDEWKLDGSSMIHSSGIKIWTYLGIRLDNPKVVINMYERYLIKRAIGKNLKDIAASLVKWVVKK